MSALSSHRRALIQAAGAATLGGLAPTVRAQGATGLPSGTIRILVGFPAGGGSDVMARHIAEKLRERTGNNVIVENRSGASGVIAVDALKKAAPDGLTLMYGTAATTVAQFVSKKAPLFDPSVDMTPLGLTGLSYTAYVLSTTIPPKTVAEYAAWVKANPQRNTFGTTALGSNTHFFGVLLARAAGVQVDPVAYKGAAPLMADLFAGHVAAGCGGLTDFLTQHQAGKLKLVAVSAARRSPAAPDVPTVAELGYPNLTYEGFYGFYGPPKMNPALVEAVSRELAATINSPDLKAKLAGLGLDVQTSNAPDFVVRQNKLIENFGAMMRAVGYQPE
jgi:tripartite-type tricarboxylate transporter receptor subunit TctC